MKQILFLLLFPCFALAQYPNNGNQKITLGEQTTADGLVFRGVANDTNIITPFSDTSAYIILDTIDSKFYHYNRTTTYWSLAGGGGGSTLDTATMLLPYWRSGRFSGVLPLANGGTGASVKIFVDTFSNQTVNGIKTFKDSLFLGNVVVGKTKQNNNSVKFGMNAGLSTGDKSVAIGTNTLQNDTGGENVAIGFEAGKNLTTGSRNMLLGSSSGASLTTGSSNVVFGSTALLNCTDCAGNTAIGRESMEQTLTGASNNTFVGYSSGYSNTTGDNNSSLGFLSGYGVNGTLANTTGSNNTFIGYQSVGESSTESNRTWIGNTSTTSTWVGGNLLVGTRTNGTARLQVKGSANASEFALKVEDSGGANLLSVQNNGDVTLKNPLTVANGGTGKSSLTANKVMVGNGTNGVISATNLTWDNVNSWLGIGVATPLSAIHTNGVFTAGSTNVGYVNLKGFLWGTTGLELDYRWQSDAVSSPQNDLIFASRGYSAPNNPGGYVFNLNYSNGAMRIYSLSGTGLRPLSVSADGTLTVSSSITIKENVNNLNYGLDKIMQLQPKSFNYIDKNKYGEGLDIGFIAEDVYPIVPEATGIMDDGFIYFDAVRLIPILTKAIQEQNLLIKALEQRILILENK